MIDMIKLLLAILLISPAVYAQQIVFVPNCAGTNDTTKFSAAITQVGSNTATIRLPYKSGSRCAVNNLTIPANVTLNNEDGTGLKINTGQTLTVLGPISNPPGKRLFINAVSGQGTASLTGNVAVGTVYPQWWGATADGSTEDSTFVQAAMVAAASRKLHFLTGTYVIRNISISANTTLTADRATVKLPSSMTADARVFTPVGANITIDGLRFAGNLAGQPVDASGPRVNLPTLVPDYEECECYSNISLAGAGSAFWAGIVADNHITPGVTDLTIKNCHFSGMWGSSIVIVNVDRPTIDNNTTIDSYRSLLDLYGDNAAGTAWARDAKVTNNKAINILRYNAFLLDGYDGGLFQGNTLRNVDRSVKIEGGRRWKVKDNDFLNVITDYCDTTWGGLCNTLEGNAIQITSTDTTCGYFAPDTVTPTTDSASVTQCGARYITIEGNLFSYVGGGGVGLQTGAGGIDSIKIIDNTFHRINGAAAGVGVRITQDNIAYIPDHILIEDNLFTDIRQNAIFMYAGNNVHIRGNTFHGLQWASVSNAIIVQPEAGLVAINGLEITDNHFAFWTSGATIVLYTSTTAPPDNTVYDGFQFKGNTVNSGSASNYAVRADITTLGAAASDYILSGALFSGNTFVGRINLPHAGLHWTSDNKVTGATSFGAGRSYAPGNLVYINSAVVTPGVIAANTAYTTSVTVLGAVVGDPCSVGATTNTTNVAWTCQITSTNTITVFGTNNGTSDTASIGSTTLRVRVEQSIN